VYDINVDLQSDRIVSRYGSSAYYSICAWSAEFVTRWSGSPWSTWRTGHWSDQPLQRAQDSAARSSNASDDENKSQQFWSFSTGRSNWPQAWNSFQICLRPAGTLAAFRKLLKVHPFRLLSGVAPRQVIPALVQVLPAILQ